MVARIDPKKKYLYLFVVVAGVG